MSHTHPDPHPVLRLQVLALAHPPGLANFDNHITNEVSPLGPGGFKM